MSGSRRTLRDLMADEEREKQLLAELRQVKDRRAQDAPRLTWASEMVAPFLDLASRVQEILAPLSEMAAGAQALREQMVRDQAAPEALPDQPSHSPVALPPAPLPRAAKKPGPVSKQALITDRYEELRSRDKGLDSKPFRVIAEVIIQSFKADGAPLDRDQRTIENILSRYRRQRLAALGAEAGEAPLSRRNVKAAKPQAKVRKSGGRPSEKGQILSRYAVLRRQEPGLADKPYREIAKAILISRARDGRPLKSSERTILNILSRYDRSQRPVPGEIELPLGDGVYKPLIPAGAKTPRRNGRD